MMEVGAREVGAREVEEMAEVARVVVTGAAERLAVTGPVEDAEAGLEAGMEVARAVGGKAVAAMVVGVKVEEV